jgi:predicted GH43/DUF377 family glycosyl hydrolase
MLKVKKEGIVLSKTNLEFENECVLNPATIREGEFVHMYYRAVKEGNHSTIGYCKLYGALKIVERWEKPIIKSEFDYESHGVEDPRIVKIEDTYYLTYTAYDGVNARGALATSKDLIHFKKHGLIVPSITYAKFVSIVEAAGTVNENYYTNRHFYYQEEDPEKKIILWDKNVVFFPRKIKGNFVFLHRIRPGIQIVSVKSLDELTEDYWIDYFNNFQEHIVMDPVYKHESSYIGSGCPPIETDYGWILIYHGVEETEHGRVYSACAAALLDLDNPAKVIARLPYVLFKPEYEWELKGEVNNVVFPTGTALFDDTLYIYYGAADTHIACASVSFSELIAELLTHIQKK